MSERVTWLIPVKNGMPYLPETLASLENQTYKNWEVIVWDNGSTDGTIEELKKWIPARLPGQIIVNRHLSVGASLAQMVKMCGTEFCARLDADDINLPERLEKQLEFLSQYPEVAVVGGQIYPIDENGIPKEYLLPMPLDHKDILHCMLSTNSISHPSVLFRRSLILQVGNYKDLPNIEDYDLWLRVAQRFKLANLPIPIIKYRVHENGTTIVAIRENRLKQLVDDWMCENAIVFFGCSESEMRLLRNQNHPYAWQAILKIANHFQKTQGRLYTDIISSSSFIENAMCLVSSKDIISIVILGMRHPDRAFLYRKLKSIFQENLKQIPGISMFKKQLNQFGGNIQK